MIKAKHYVVVIEGTYEDSPVRFRHVVEALDEFSALVKVGYRLGKKLQELEITSATVRQA